MELPASVLSKDCGSAESALSTNGRGLRQLACAGPWCPTVLLCGESWSLSLTPCSRLPRRPDRHAGCSAPRKALSCVIGWTVKGLCSFLAGEWLGLPRCLRCQYYIKGASPPTWTCLVDVQTYYWDLFLIATTSSSSSSYIFQSSAQDVVRPLLLAR